MNNAVQLMHKHYSICCSVASPFWSFPFLSFSFHLFHVFYIINIFVSSTSMRKWWDLRLMLCFNMMLYDTNCSLEIIWVTFLAQKPDLGWFCANESDLKASSPYFFSFIGKTSPIVLEDIGLSKRTTVWSVNTIFECWSVMGDDQQMLRLKHCGVE